MKQKTLEKNLNSYEIAENGCWNWTRCKHPKGYGQIGTSKDGVHITLKAHRFFYEHYKGSVPAHLCVCHVCDNPSCVNPDHLWLGTNKDNSQDMVKKGRNPNTAGTNNPNAKLTPAQVREIRESYIRGVTKQQDLADKYDIPQTQVSRIIRGVHWGSVSK
jgi:hypothetical protein